VNCSLSSAFVTDVPDAALDATVLDLVNASLTRLTPIELTRRIRQTHRAIQRGRVASSIRRLVEQKALVYTYQFGNSFLEPSFEKPVRVANTIVLKPPDCDHRALPGDIVINIKPGAAFGTGCHVTTRLSLAGLEHVCRAHLPWKPGGRVLDIGTGSGILAIAALKFGMQRGIGLDIDPCARAEASENAGLNGLAQCLDISDRSLDRINGRFGLILANLRLPTLTAYFDRMSGVLDKGGFLVLSGIKANEIGALKGVGNRHDMQTIWEDKALGWGGLVFSRREKAASMEM
jgi:ribosomal protein L11 methylase PrmA